MKRVRVKIPATTSNLGPGFDVLGMALDLYNDVTVTVLNERGPARVEITGEGAGALPDGESNLIVRSLRTRLSRKRLPKSLHIRCVNRIPLDRGLGSSAAARLAGLLAGEALKTSGSARPESALLDAVRLEGHPDNAVPAFFGGLCGAAWNGKELRHFQLRTPNDLACAICIPDIRVPTAKARAILPKKVPFADAVATSSRLALLIAALESRRYGWLSEAMADVLHQPYRAKLVNGFQHALTAAKRAGALGAALSGSGPTVFAFAESDRRADAVAQAMRRAFVRRGTGARALALRIDTRGARISLS